MSRSARGDNDGGGFGIQLPSLGPAAKWTLLVIGVISLAQAILLNWMNISWPYELLIGSTVQIRAFELWRLLTASMLCPPSGFVNGTLFPLLGLYFFLPGIEKRMGTRRTLQFIILAALIANSVTTALDFLPYPGAVLHHHIFSGFYAVLTAVVVAFSLLNPDSVIRLFFVIPITGKQLKWVELALIVFSFIYGDHVGEGPFAPFVGWGFGMLFGGAPSLVRSTYLKFKLARLQKVGASAQGKRGRPLNSPSLRIVYGGLADELEVDDKPKNKNDLN
jgi:membrane associated rhomboid family serine protease